MFPASHGRGGAASIHSGAGSSGHGRPSRPDPTTTYGRKCQNRPISRSAPPAEKPDRKQTLPVTVMRWRALKENRAGKYLWRRRQTVDRRLTPHDHSQEYDV
jgi:hypothetical protein